MNNEEYVATITIETDDDFILCIGDEDKSIHSIDTISVSGISVQDVRNKVISAITNARVTWAKSWTMVFGNTSYAPAWESIKSYFLESINENPDDLYWSVGGNCTITVSINKTTLKRYSEVKWYLIDHDGLAVPYISKEAAETAAEKATAIRKECGYELGNYRVAAMIELNQVASSAFADLNK